MVAAHRSIYLTNASKRKHRIGDSAVRILVVEDDTKVADFIAKGFEQEGHAVDVAYDGQTGADQATNLEYDIVVLDLMLPKLSGIDVITRIRARKQRLPVIMLSAKGEVDDRITG